ncbi:LPS export ABC transporter periplasmic protein LptC [Nitratidesulfovibrio liaohensis]|uniref:LPS export ABC transporter periplasmic protein LptC n=1 Tax=Nitratidesulfovibrio liaohensis TaxID=2604158 RepID=UPI0014208832|nr:LPS export ABC transporter periplasmic protein LptC [Nitratidesulfovibrio liaohensis]NHZ48778.1 LPS export ABC transporter periplasmic protein LptC [Nitratidesulfovibrio liaohensis]
MRRRTLLLLLLVVLVVGGAAAWRWQAGMRKALETAISGGDVDPATLEEAVGVAMKGIELVQGEKGIELWRLKATWAQLRQSNNIIDVDSPDIVYQMDGGKQVRILAKKGEVQQQAQMMRMWDDVHATHDRHELFARLMVYNGTSRTMYFPEGARIEGQSLSGNATRLEWDMTNDVLRGSDGVSMLLAPHAGDGSGQPGPGKVAAPQTSPKASSQKAIPQKAAVQKKTVQKSPEKKSPDKKAPVQKSPAAKAAQQGAGASKSTKQETRQ